MSVTRKLSDLIKSLPPTLQVPANSIITDSDGNLGLGYLGIEAERLTDPAWWIKDLGIYLIVGYSPATMAYCAEIVVRRELNHNGGTIRIPVASKDIRILIINGWGTIDFDGPDDTEFYKVRIKADMV